MECPGPSGSKGAAGAEKQALASEKLEEGLQKYQVTHANGSCQRHQHELCHMAFKHAVNMLQASELDAAVQLLGEALELTIDAYGGMLSQELR